jgi:hypothetical protein
VGLGIRRALKHNAYYADRRASTRARLGILMSTCWRDRNDQRGYLDATARLSALPISRRLVTFVTFGSQAEREYLPWLGPGNVECRWFGTEYVAQVSQIFSRRTFIHVGRAAQEARQPADAAASASLCLTSEARRQDGKAGVPHSVVWLHVDVAPTSLSKRSGDPRMPCLGCA